MQRKVYRAVVLVACLVLLALFTPHDTTLQAQAPQPTPPTQLFLPSILVHDLPSDAPRPQWLTQFKALDWQLVVENGLAYTSAGSKFIILDVSTADQPREVGNLVLPQSVMDIAVYGSYAYVAISGESLQIVDVSNPATPRLSATYRAVNQRSGRLEGVDTVTVAGGYAYLSTWENLHIVDVSNPLIPRLVKWIHFTNEDEGLVSITIAGSYAYISISEEYVGIWDISEPANAQLVGRYWGASDPWQVIVVGKYAYVQDYDGNVNIVDVSDPAAPRRVGNYPSATKVHGIAIAGVYLYVAAGQAGLRIVDISNPVAPTEVGFYPAPTSLSRVAVGNDRVYVMDLRQGVRALDTTDPTKPREVGAYAIHAPSDTIAIALRGPYAYLTEGSVWDSRSLWGGLWIVDVSNPLTPRTLGYYDTPGDARGIDVQGPYAYVCDTQVGLIVIDVSDPSRLREVGVFKPAQGDEYLGDVQVVGQYAYVTSLNVALYVLDISDPTWPVEVGRYMGRGYGNRLHVESSRAYITVGSRLLSIVDVSDPTAPRELGHYDPPDHQYIHDVYVVGDYAYLTGSSFKVVDISNPTTPRLVGAYADAEGNEGVYVAGPYAFLSNGLQVIDVADPSAPRQARLPTGRGSGQDLAIDANYGYVVGFHGGLHIFRLR